MDTNVPIRELGPVESDALAQAPDAAIQSAVQARIRPIFLTVGTSSLAVLPLVLAQKCIGAWAP
jgi:multidrug efflux pump subunit AcrB